MEQQLAQQLVQEGHGIITIASGETPVIDSESMSETAEKTVNFLRSGCPQVQIIITKHDSSAYEKQHIATIKALALEGEVFQFSPPVPMPESSGGYDVVMLAVSRSVHQ